MLAVVGGDHCGSRLTSYDRVELEEPGRTRARLVVKEGGANFVVGYRLGYKRRKGKTAKQMEISTLVKIVECEQRHRSVDTASQPFYSLF
jgi:hypothetical protein